MLGWFRALMPREERFFELFTRHAQVTLAGAEALKALLSGGGDVLRCCNEVISRENEAGNHPRGADGIATIVHHSTRSRRHQGPDNVDG